MKYFAGTPEGEFALTNCSSSFSVPHHLNQRKEHVLSESDSLLMFVPSLSWKMIDCHQKVARQKAAVYFAQRRVPGRTLRAVLARLRVRVGAVVWISAGL
eukprot:COSAG06_NODE_29437_length_556_cov_1.203501_1_plen_99_part_10